MAILENLVLSNYYLIALAKFDLLLNLTKLIKFLDH